MNPRGARPRVGRAAPGAAVLWLVSTGACAQVLGLHDRGEAVDASSGSSTADDGDASTVASLAVGHCGNLQHSTAACASCMDSSCCDQAKACAADPACKEASACLAACTDASCRANCREFYAVPNTLMALRACRIQSCASACASTCGEFSSPIPSCQACWQASCCTQGTACASNTSCAALDLCQSNCFEATNCPSDCDQKYPQGTTAYGAWSSCVDSCASACAPGQSWSCVNAVVWPKPTTGSVAFSVTFVDFALEHPFVGANVKACSNIDVSCSNPLSTGTTDDTGLVSLTLPVGQSGFNGYLDVSGGKIDGTGAAAYPALWYPVPFVVADGWRGRTTILSVDEFTGLAAATGTTLDPTRGHFAANATDCAFTPAAQVSFVATDADSQTQSFYLVNGAPVTTATATDPSATGGFINLPPGLQPITAVAGAAGGKKMGELTFVVRAGTLTTMSSYPPTPL